MPMVIKKKKWDIWSRKIEPIAAYLPYQTSIGNHDYGIVALLNIFTYSKRFFMPKNGDGPYYYSFNYGHTHLLAIDSEGSLDLPFISETQQKWIEQDLIQANKNRNKFPWIIVYFHRPLYCSGDYGNCVLFAETLRLMVEEVLYEQRVDLVFTAHRHDYERYHPTFAGKVFGNDTYPQAPIYIVNGAGGNREGLQGFDGKIPDICAFRVQAYGYNILKISKNELNLKFFGSDNNQMLDQLTIKKNYGKL